MPLLIKATTQIRVVACWLSAGSNGKRSVTMARHFGFARLEKVALFRCVGSNFLLHPVQGTL